MFIDFGNGCFRQCVCWIEQCDDNEDFLLGFEVFVVGLDCYLFVFVFEQYGNCFSGFLIGGQLQFGVQEVWVVFQVRLGYLIVQILGFMYVVGLQCDVQVQLIQCGGVDYVCLCMEQL